MNARIAMTAIGVVMSALSLFAVELSTSADRVESPLRVNTICGQSDSIRFDLIPAAVFTMPEVATIGLTEEQCKEQELEVRCLKSFYRANGKAVSMDETDGYCKVITGQDGAILGAHLMGAHASDLIHEIAVIIKMGGTLEQMQSVIHAHPTLSEVLQSALHQ